MIKATSVGLFAGIVLCAASSVSASEPPSERYLAVEVPRPVAGETALFDMGLDPLSADAKHIVFRVSEAERDELQSAGFDATVIDENIYQTWAERSAGESVGSTATWTAYHDLAGAYDFMTDLNNAYPNITSLSTIGTSVEGRDIRLLKISDHPNTVEHDEPATLLCAMHHAREWISVEVALYLADHICQNYATDPRIKRMVNASEIYVVPVVNPDGFQYAWLADRFWRKNRRNNGDGTFGVDLNRNYSYQWGGLGASPYSWEETYRGPGPFSEPETQTIRDMIEGPGGRDFDAIISYHNFLQLVLYPWGYTYSDAPDASTLSWLASEMAWRITAVHGFGYDAWQSSDLYPASGDTTDWAYGVHGTMAFTIELRPNSGDIYSFALPEDQILATCEENLPGALWLIDWTLPCPSAGTLDLDADVYGCESQMEIELTDCDLDLDPNAVDTATVTVSSPSEPAGEVVTLTESDVSTGYFLGTVALSATNAPGVLAVSHGETITAAYNDADDGTGQPATVQVTALADCPSGPRDYEALFLGGSMPGLVEAGAQVSVSMSFQNVGLNAWDANTLLATSGPRGRSSAFHTPSDWISASTVASMDQASVAPGQTATFTFLATAPATAGLYAESFELRQDTVSWFLGTGDDAVWNVRVTTPPEDKLLNGDFEGGFGSHWGGRMPNSWGTAYRDPWADGPVWWDEDLGGEHGHALSMSSLNFGQECGVKQQVFGLSPGEPFTLTAEAYRAGTGMTAWLAVDPDGGTAFPAADTSFPGAAGQWQSQQVSGTVGSSGVVTVFLWAWNQSGSNDVWFDNATLMVGGYAPEDPPAITAASSVRTHGSAGDFAVNVPLLPVGNDPIECRSDGPQRIEVTFDQEIQGADGLDVSDVTVNSGTVTNLSITGSTLTIELANVVDGMPLTLGFGGIEAVAGQLAAVDTLCLGVLAGDTDGDGVVNIFDLLNVRNSLGQPVSGTTFRGDIDPNGTIDIFDLLAVRNRLTATVSGMCAD